MKTVKQLIVLIFFFSINTGHSQYLETFSTVNKGVLAGPCGVTAASCVSNDFVGVDWDLNGQFTGVDSNDNFSTDGTGRLHGNGDCDATIDPGICFEIPVLDISTAGAVGFSMDLEWISWDVGDKCFVDYQLDGGSWVTLPPLPGTDGPTTIDFNSDANSGTAVASASGLAGNTLSIRVCMITNSSGDALYIDNVSVPQAGTMILPVKWEDFKVRSLKDGNQLDWATYTEVNNEKFEIEKSVNDVLDFKTIGSVEGAGNSTVTSRYEFLDLDQSSEVAYYRIKQVDFDGRFEYSEVLSVRNNRTGKLGFTPNPFTDQLLISSNQLELIEGTTLTMFNNQGQKMLKKTITELNINDPIETEHLQAGMYFMHFSHGEIVRVVKF